MPTTEYRSSEVSLSSSIPGGGVVVVGAGQAGADVTGSLRTAGYTGPITLIGDEGYAPYRRPPLSKQFLSDEMTLDSLYIRSPAAFAVPDSEEQPGGASADGSP